MTLEADPDQLEQRLINLMRNAVDAALETGGGVSVSWNAVRGWAEVRIEDEGPGIAEPRTCSSRSSPPSPKAPASASR